MEFEFNFAVASTFGLFLNVINTSTASIRHYKQKVIDFKIAIPIILASFIGSPIGASLVNVMDETLLKQIFAVVLLLIGIYIILKALRKESDEEIEFEPSIKTYTLMIFVGLLVGFVFGLLGIAGGAITLVSLLFLKINTKKAAGTTSFVIVFSALFSFISKVYINNIKFDPILLIGGIIFSILGAIIGSYTMHFKLNDVQIKLIISLIVMVVGIRLLLVL